MTDPGASSYRRYLQGDKGALEELVIAYADPLVRFCNTYLHDMSLSEDVMEDTFAVLIASKKPFREEAKFKTYLFRIARNRCIDVLRARKRVVYREEVFASAPEDPETYALDSAETTLLYEALLALPDLQRQAIELVYLEGFRITETARILKKSRKQIYNLLARAKENLKRKLNKEGIFHENNA